MRVGWWGRKPQVPPPPASGPSSSWSGTPARPTLPAPTSSCAGSQPSAEREGAQGSSQLSAPKPMASAKPQVRSSRGVPSPCTAPTLLRPHQAGEAGGSPSASSTVSPPGPPSVGPVTPLPRPPALSAFCDARGPPPGLCSLPEHHLVLQTLSLRLKCSVLSEALLPR